MPDLKSACMQVNSIDASMGIYMKPISDMRHRLERLMGLKPHQILKAVKPAFGDVRAPRQWYDTTDGEMSQKLKFFRHALDKCLYMSARVANAENNPFCIFQDNDIDVVVDGVLGLHFDNYIGAGILMEPSRISKINFVTWPPDSNLERGLLATVWAFAVPNSNRV